MRNQYILDATFDIQITSSYHLAVQLSPSGICYAILDTVRMKFLAFKNLWFGAELADEELYNRIDTLFRTEGYLNRNFRHVSIYFTSPYANLIPAPFYQAESADRMDGFLGTPKSPQVLLNKYIKHLDAYLVYKIPERIHALGEHHMDTPVFFHQAIPLIENALFSSKGKSGFNQVYAQINTSFIDILVIKNGKMVLYNAFPYKTAKDLAFYILYVFEQFQLAPKLVRLELSGFTDEADEYVQILKSYIREIGFQEFNRSFSYSLSFNELTQHHYSNLINLFRCE